MSWLYHTFFHDPLLNGLVFLYQTVALEDLGLAIILLTILIRIILFPVFQKSVRYQMAMQEIQPKLKKIQETHKKNLEQQSAAMMALYKEHRLNPFSGFLLLLVQLPILIALYRIFLNISKPGALAGLYGFISVPAELHTSLLGLINLEESNMVIVVLAAIAQYLQGRFSIIRRAPNEEAGAAEKMTRRMNLIIPLLTLLIFSGLPAAVSLYWLTSSLFSIGQQVLVNRQIAHGKLARDAQKTD